MSKTFLRLFSIDVLIEFVINYLASTVKNPESKNAVRLRYYVLKLHDGTEHFLKATSPYTDKN